MFSFVLSFIVTAYTVQHTWVYASDEGDWLQYDTDQVGLLDREYLAQVPVCVLGSNKATWFKRTRKKSKANQTFVTFGAMQEINPVTGKRREVRRVLPNQIAQCKSHVPCVWLIHQSHKLHGGGGGHECCMYTVCACVRVLFSCYSMHSITVIQIGPQPIWNVKIPFFLFIWWLLNFGAPRADHTSRHA